MAFGVAMIFKTLIPILLYFSSFGGWADGMGVFWEATTYDLSLWVFTNALKVEER